MKLKYLLVIIALGIIASVGYVAIQKTEITKAASESEETSQTEQDLQTVTDETESAADVSQGSETQNSTEEEEQEKNVTVDENGKVLINDVPLIQQMPELARGCEVTSLTMMLQYAGVSIDKMTLATQITTVPFKYQNGLKGNPYDGFVGDIYTFDKSGYGVYHGPIADLAEKYLPGKIVDLTGKSIDSVYDMIDQGSPVWVITNSRFSLLPDSQFSVWNTPSGQVKITYREHSVLIVGYDENNVYINDPLADQPYKSISRENFEASWTQMGSQAISYEL